LFGKVEVIVDSLENNKLCLKLPSRQKTKFIVKMVKRSFILVGAPAGTAQDIEIDLQNTFEYLQWDVAQHFSIAEPSGATTSSRNVGNRGD
jgi:hypothetical protein